MPETITLESARIDGFHVWQEEDLDGTRHIYVSVGYRLTTSDGGSWTKTLTREVPPGAARNRLDGIIPDLRNFIRSEEGDVTVTV